METQAKAAKNNLVFFAPAYAIRVSAAFAAGARRGLAKAAEAAATAPDEVAPPPPLRGEVRRAALPRLAFPPPPPPPHSGIVAACTLYSDLQDCEAEAVS